MSLVRLTAAAAAWWCGVALGAQEPLAPAVVTLVDEALAGARPEASADKLWQAAAAQHGNIESLLRTVQARVDQHRSPGASRLLCGILRYQGRPEAALTALDAIPTEQQLQRDLLLRAELLDTLESRRRRGPKPTTQLLANTDLDAKLRRRRILFRRALVGSDSIAQLQGVRQPAPEQRSRTAQPGGDHSWRCATSRQAALELYEVHGEGTVRFRQLVRLAEWALAAKEFDRSRRSSAGRRCEVAKMKS